MMNRNYKIIVAITGAVCVTGVIFGVHRWTNGGGHEPPAVVHEFPRGTVEDAMRREADQINPSLPIMIVYDTRLDSVAAGPGNRFTYNYTLLTVDIGAIPPDKLKEFKASVFNSVCSTLAELRRNGTLVIYRYKMPKGDDTAEIEIPTVECPK